MRNLKGLLSQKSRFDQYLHLQEHHLSAFHFSSVFLWQDFFDFEFELIEDSLCIFAQQKGGSFLYLPPLSERQKPSVIESCFKKMDKINPRTARIENIEQYHLDSLDDQFKIYRKLEEYVYLNEDLIALRGHAYKSQRHDIHHFQQHHQALFRSFESKDIKDCLRLYEDWAKNRHDKHKDEVYRSMLEENRIVHELAMTYQKELGLIGFVVEVCGKIAAYSLGYSLNCDTFCVLLEISDFDLTGLPAFIFNRVCSDQHVRKHRLINTMDDFCMPHVAASKQAYHPKFKPVSYTITLKNISASNEST